MPLMARGLFRSVRTCVHSTPAAVIADVVVGGVVDHGFVVDVVNIRDVDVVHRAVVVEGSVVPISALIADAAITEAVVDAAVEADLRAPVAIIPGVGVATPAPITRSPEQARFRSHHPRTRHPEVAFLAVGPVTGRPYIALSGGHRLFIHRKCRRSDGDRHAELRE